jgi:hypothetical protein
MKPPARVASTIPEASAMPGATIGHCAQIPPAIKPGCQAASARRRRGPDRRPMQGQPAGMPLGLGHPAGLQDEIGQDMREKQGGEGRGHLGGL